MNTYFLETYRKFVDVSARETCQIGDFSKNNAKLVGGRLIFKRKLSIGDFSSKLLKIGECKPICQKSPDIFPKTICFLDFANKLQFFHMDIGHFYFYFLFRPKRPIHMIFIQIKEISYHQYSLFIIIFIQMKKLFRMCLWQINR